MADRVQWFMVTLPKVDVFVTNLEKFCNFHIFRNIHNVVVCDFKFDDAQEITYDDRNILGQIQTLHQTLQHPCHKPKLEGHHTCSDSYRS